MNDDLSIKITGLKKRYRLGQIGGGTLTADLQSWWARVRGKEDPNVKIGEEQRQVGETFMALNGIDLEVKHGEAVGIIGHNGAGKSTLLKLLSRITAPTEGTIELNGRIASMLEVGTGFSGEMTGRENIYLNGAILGMTKAEIDAKMEQIIEFSEVREFIDTPVKRYSSGMYVKLAFSVAAHLDSEIMIMDEVLAVGDVKFQQKCLDKMSDAATKEGKTVLYVSHNMDTIRRLCTRCIVLSEGRVIYDGEVDKAIAIYLKSGIKNEGVFYDYKDVKRESWVQKVSNDELRSLELIGKENNIYYDDEKIECEIDYHPNTDKENMGIRFEINTMDGARCGTAATEYEKLMHLDANKPVKLRYSIDISNLTAGEYCVCLMSYTCNEYNQYHDIDCIRTAFSFKKDHLGEPPKWNIRSFGHVMLPYVCMTSVEEYTEE